MSKVVSQENLVDFGQQFKNKLSDVAISGSYNDLVDTPGDLQEYRQFTLFSDQAEGSYPSTPGNNDWKWYTNLDKLAPTSNSNRTWYGDWSTVATTTTATPIIWVATATFQSSDGTIVSDWETYQATGSTGAPGQNGSDGQKGDTGNGISSVTKTGTSGLVDTYTITFTNGNTTTFTVTNGADGSDGADGQNGADGNDGSPGAPGKSAYQVAVDNGYSGTEAQWLASLKGETGNGIESIELTAQASGGSADEYTITLTDGTTSTFEVHHGVNGTNGTNGTNGNDGNGISSITKTSTSGLVDTYRISYTNGTSSTFTVTNGANGTNGTNGTNGNDGNGISSITKIGTSGLVDTYRISYTNGSSSTFTVTNGSNGTNGTNGTSATVSVGTVTTGAEGSSATVTNSGTSSNAVLNFTIPVGATGQTGSNGDDGYYLDVDNPNVFIPVDSNGHPVDDVFAHCNIKLYKGTTRCNILDLGINDNTYTDSAIIISGNILSITGDGNQNGYTALSIDISKNYTLSSVENYIIYLRENSGGYVGQFVLKLIPVVQSSQLANGTLYAAVDTSFTLSQLKSNSVLIADGGGDITFTLPAGDAEMDGRTIKIMVISGSLAVTANSYATTIVSLGAGTADPGTGLFPATCVLEATYYWANGSDFIYLYQTTT